MLRNARWFVTWKYLENECCGPKAVYLWCDEYLASWILRLLLQPLAAPTLGWLSQHALYKRIHSRHPDLSISEIYFVRLPTFLFYLHSSIFDALHIKSEEATLYLLNTRLCNKADTPIINNRKTKWWPNCMFWYHHSVNPTNILQRPLSMYTLLFQDFNEPDWLKYSS